MYGVISPKRMLLLRALCDESPEELFPTTLSSSVPKLQCPPSGTCETFTVQRNKKVFPRKILFDSTSVIGKPVFRWDRNTFWTTKNFSYGFVSVLDGTHHIIQVGAEAMFFATTTQYCRAEPHSIVVVRPKNMYILHTTQDTYFSVHVVQEPAGMLDGQKTVIFL